ncbi:MAG: glycosyltransferase family 87 protein, partial [Gemmatimonadales bacterium]
FLLRRRLRALAPHRLLAAALTLAWFPMFHSVIGGQNTAITFALLAAIYVGTAERRPWLAGVPLGLLTFKPQYALPVGLVLLARRQYTGAAIAAGVALLLYGVAAVYCGWDWPARLLEGMRLFAVQERGANGPMLMSVVEVLDFALVRPLRHSLWPQLATAVRLAGWVVVAGLGVYLLAAGRRIAPGGERYGAYWALLVATLLLVSPHVAYYDSALLALAVVLLLDYLLASRGAVSTAVRIGLVAGFFAYAAAPWAYLLGFQPLIVLSLAVLLWAASLLRESGGLAAAPLTRPIAPPPPA